MFKFKTKLNLNSSNMRNSKVMSPPFHSLKPFIFIMILLQGLSMVQNQYMNAGQVNNISGDIGQFSTLSQFEFYNYSKVHMYKIWHFVAV